MIDFEKLKKELEEVEDSVNLYHLVVRDLLKVLLSRNIIDIEVTDNFTIGIWWRDKTTDCYDEYDVVELVDEIVKNIKEKGEGKE